VAEKLAAVLILLILSSAFFPFPVDKVAFLDVGQGDAILLQNGTQQVLVDGGQGMVVLRRLGEEMPWFDRTIEVVVLTHPERDHLEGLVHVLQRYDVGLVVMPRQSSSSALSQSWLEELIKRNTPYRFGRRGQRINLAQIKLDLISPESSNGQRVKNSNDASIAMKVDFHGLTFMLTGDIGSSVENKIVAAVPASILRADVLKVAHHGSKSSTTDTFLSAVSPEVAVISVGGNNSYGHPHDSVIKRLAGQTVWRTDENGTIKFIRPKDKWYVAFAG